MAGITAKIHRTTVIRVSQGNPGPVGMQWKDDWAAGDYKKRDAVNRLGVLYIANKNTDETPAVDAIDWDVLLEPSGGSLGTAAERDVGTGANQIPDIEDADARYANGAATTAALALKAATTYVNAQDAATLAAANAYTDAELAGIDLTDYYTKAEADVIDAAVQEAAEDYTDAAVANVAHTNTANDFSASQTPDAGGTRDLGTTVKWWKDLFLGGATKYLRLTVAALTGDRTVTFPDADSNTVQPTTATASQWVRNIDSAGVQTKSQPAFTDISGTATAGQIPSLDASKITTGRFGKAQVPAVRIPLSGALSPWLFKNITSSPDNSVKPLAYYDYEASRLELMQVVQGTQTGGTTADVMNGIAQAVTGDFTATVKIPSDNLTASSNSVLAILEARESTTQGSPFIRITSRLTDRLFSSLYRTTENAAASSTGTNNFAGASPGWLRITRVGNVFTTYKSTDGTNFTQDVQQTISMASGISIILTGFTTAASNLHPFYFDNFTVA